MDLGRYRDKPFLLLLEAYVLDAIGELKPATEQLANTVSAKIFGEGDWKERVRAEVGFEKGLGPQVAQLWKENVKIAKDKGAELDPTEFAQALVEANFGEIIEMATADIAAEDPKEDDDAY